MKSNYEILVLLRHYWKQGFKATESVQKINQIEGEGQVVNRTAQFWFKKFSQGDTSLKRKKVLVVLQRQKPMLSAILSNKIPSLL